MPSVVLLTGPAAAGKTTVARIVASGFERSVHVDADHFFSAVIGGYVDPWESEAHDQNAVVMAIAADVAIRYADAGYVTVLEGMFIPGWFYEPTLERLERAGLDVSAAILRPSLSTTLARGRARTEPKRLPDAQLENLWGAFADLGPLERLVLENDTQSPEETAGEVRRRLDDGA